TNVNEAPVLNDAAFALAENSAAGTAVATLTATDPDAGSTFTYSILAGNTGGAFALDPTTGQITVANPAALDFETTPSFTLTVQVTDAGGLTDTATITVDLNDANEVPDLADAVFALAENSAAGIVVGSVAATDPDAGSTFTYSILAGNSGGAFALDPTTGQLTVANPTALDFETTPSFTLTVQVTDSGGLTDNATITVNLTNVNEAPVLNDAAFSVAENSAAGTAVATLAATDPDAGETFTYSILGGNTNGAFALDPTTGQLTVANPAALDFETTPTFSLAVQVTDAGGLADTAAIAVDLTNANEAPSLAGASFAIDENSIAGTWVGSLAATDPDAGETFSYAILSGNSGGAFALDPTTGQITVANPSALDFETTPSFSLTVQVTDAGGLSGTRLVSIGTTDLVEFVPSLPPGLQLPAEPPLPPPADDTRPVLIPPAPLVDLPTVPEMSTALDAHAIDAPVLELGRGLPETWRHAALATAIESAEHRSSRGEERLDAERFASLDQQKLFEALDRLNRELTDEAPSEETLALAIEAMGLVMSAGILAALMRSGALAAAALSAAPLWRRVDPLAILALSEEERWQREQDMRIARLDEESARLFDLDEDDEKPLAKVEQDAREA
ncbi:MAG TPA: cadherin repeat domain-containing protein, partial [Myxococcota bacterium]|nr:cadherin repeat domain-containing protein [Myxococcota bacterium]